MRLALWLCMLGCYFFCSLANATHLQLDSQASADINLNQWIYVAEAPDAKTVAEIKALDSNHWQKLSLQQIPAISELDIWLTFSISSANGYQSRILSFNNPHLDRIEVFHQINDVQQDTVLMGDNLPFLQRPLLSRVFLYPINMKPGENHRFYIHLQSKGSSLLPIMLNTPNNLLQATENESFKRGIQLGALLSIGVFTFFIAMITRSFSYIYYAGYVLSVSTLVATLHGTAFRFVWPTIPDLQSIIIPILIPFSMGFAAMFTEKVLLLKYNNIPMLRACRYVTLYCVSLLFLTPFVSYGSLISINLLSIIFVCSLLMFIGIMEARKGNSLARFYVFAWTSMLLGAITTALLYLGVIHAPFMPYTPIMIGLTFEVVFMAVVLAIRYNAERKSKIKIQQEALRQAEKIREAREASLRAEAESSEKLEQMVQERTLELEIALRELNEANSKLTEQSTIDSLTGVKNRGAFDKRLVAEGRISRRQQTAMAILMIDIDKFKAINDKFGHLAGDEALRVIGKALSFNIRRPSDLVSRYGGEEFAIILPNTTIEGATLVAETIRQAVESLDIRWEDVSIPLTVSIGCSADIIQDDNHPRLLLEQADKALYEAKNSGRNRVSCTPATHTAP
ncbi:sensor domain-containing diguanylate cyclase [Shewanella gelidii]|uniref:diguanylate cyclase n=1 Tax=Shewanella gelidii TaxID=1642821 RepID=A0A917JVB6_9GAMM|nr:diguanylate cyclase [Shewanella gelidii]MCL1098728.1 diguanylate cyclase [Shewanella gelidii]GGI88068.1 deoxynucleoside kinase [Shewanella gelidii]